MHKKISLPSGVVSFMDAGLPDRPVVVLLHAYPQDRRMWLPQLESFSPQYRVIIPDLPGFGESSLPENWTIDSAADMVAALLRQLNINQVVLAGLSMGGYTAMAFARRHPALLRGLILAATKAEPDDAEAKANRDKMMVFAQSHGSDGVIQAMLPKLVGQTTLHTQPYVAEQVSSIASSQSVPAIIAALKALRDRPDAMPELAHVTVPTLIIVGSEDQVTPLTKSEAMARTIPGAQLVMLPECGHMANLEKATEFNEAVSQFLAALPN